VEVEDAQALNTPSESDLESWSSSTNSGTPGISQGEQRSSAGGGSGRSAGSRQKLRNRPITRAELLRQDHRDGGFAAEDDLSSSRSSARFRSSSQSPGSVSSSGDGVSCDAPFGITDFTPLTSVVGQYSAGSALHDTGCKPCLFVNTVLGCQNGADCEYCHLQHSRGTRNRPGKGKRDRYRKLIARITSEDSNQNGSQSGSSTRGSSERGCSSAGADTRMPQQLHKGNLDQTT